MRRRCGRTEGSPAVRFLLVLPILLFSLGASAFAEERALAVFVSDSSPLKDISKADLRRVFSGEPVEAGGVRLIPLNLPPQTNERKAFDSAVLGLSPEEMPKYWIDRRIRALGMPPKTAPTPEVLLKAARFLPGAVVYAPLASLPVGLRVLTIDGKAPSDPGYVLKF